MLLMMECSAVVVAEAEVGSRLIPEVLARLGLSAGSGHLHRGQVERRRSLLEVERRVSLKVHLEVVRFN